MSCLGVDIRILNSVSKVLVKPVKDLGVSVSMLKRRVCNAVIAVVRDASNFSSSVLLLGGDSVVNVSAVNSNLSVNVAMVCSPDIAQFYLEIEPELIWVYDNMENYNNVFSNTSWIIN